MNNVSDSPAAAAPGATPVIVPPPATAPSTASTSRFAVAQIPAFPSKSINTAPRLSPFAAPPPNALTDLLPHDILPIPRDSSIGKFTAVIPPFNGKRTIKPPVNPAPPKAKFQPRPPPSLFPPYTNPTKKPANGSKLKNEAEKRPRRSQASASHAMDIDGAGGGRRSDWESETMQRKGYDKDPDFRASRENSANGSDISDGDPPEYEQMLRQMPVMAELDIPGRRKFIELENISFASPTAFTSMAFTIAEDRGLSLIIADDRTHKATAAYLHICCSHRQIGCPFILRLTKAREGGWVIKSSTNSEPDPKSRSIFRCRHDSIQASYAVGVEKPMPNGGPGRPKAAKKKPFGGSIAPNVPVAVPTYGRPERMMADMRQREKELMSSLHRANEGGMGNTSQHQFIPPAHDDPIHDRALAPPFERSLALIPQIEPVLRPPNWTNSHDPNLSIYASSNSQPRTQSDPRRASYTPDDDIDIPRRYLKQSGRPLPLYYEPPRIIKLPPSPPECLPQWTAFFTLLDPELVFLAPKMASPALAVSPGSFFDEDEELRNTLLDNLEIGAWHKIKLKAKMNRAGKGVWESIKGQSFAVVEESDAMDVGEDGPRRPLTMDTTPVPPSHPIPSTASPGQSTPGSATKGRTRLPHELLGPGDVLETREKSQSVS